MTYITQRDFMLEVSRGNISGMSNVIKFGRAPDGGQTTATDVWDRADATPTQQIWIAPTAARTHDIASTSTDDDGDPAGVGARTIKVYGLTGWGSAETSETITMNGTTNVATSNAYVIIHKMEVLTKGATNVNVGTITATAQTDSSVTAAILPGIGQTRMAIYGVPSTKKLYLTRYHGSINKQSGVAATADFSLEYNPEPDVELTNFVIKHVVGTESDGASFFDHAFDPRYEFAGPGIIKIQVITSAADIDVTAGFNGILVDN